MYFVYSIQSEASPDHYYVGVKTNIDQRIQEHNSGKSFHTNKFAPWRLLVYVAFTDKSKAQKFERYLKTGSGRGFCLRHF